MLHCHCKQIPVTHQILTKLLLVLLVVAGLLSTCCIASVDKSMYPRKQVGKARGQDRCYVFHVIFLLHVFTVACGVGGGRAREEHLLHWGVLGRSRQQAGGKQVGRATQSRLGRRAARSSCSC